MNAYEPLTDAQLEAMLTRLTARGRSDGLAAAIMADVDTTPQQRRPWFGWSGWRLAPAPELRLVWLLAVLGLLVALVAGTLAVGSRLLESRQPLLEQQPALLEGMVVEEVDPGVFRIINDGIRDLSSTDAVDVVAGYDGGIWLLRQQGFLRLGSDGFHEWPTGAGPESHVLQVAPDGTLWVIPYVSEISPDRRGEGRFSTDGEAWSSQPCPGDYCTSVTVAPDGTLWASWYDGDACHRGLDEDCEWWVGHLGPTGWQPLEGGTPHDFAPPGFGRLYFTDAGDLYGVVCIWTCTLYRYTPFGWTRERDAYMLVAVGPDGTVWQDGGIGTDSDPTPISGSFPGDGLARFADGEWAGWTSADLPEIKYGLGLDYQFKVAPDGSLWFSLWRSADGNDPRAGDYWRWEEREGAVMTDRLVCDGLARFDGETLDRFLPGQCIAMDIAADGSVWVAAGEDEARDLYVISPEAVAPTVPTPIAPLPTVTDLTPEPSDARTIFSWVSNVDLGEWVTEDEMTDALETVAARSFAADLDGRVAADCTQDECEWSFRLVGDEGSWRLIVHNGDHNADGVADGDQRPDPSLPSGATYAVGEGFAYASFIVAGPNSGESICVNLWPPGAGFGDLDPGEVGYRASVFALSSMMLRQLGWVD